MTRLKVMVVDDDEQMRELLQLYLRKKDIDCEVFPTAEELLLRVYSNAINEPSHMPDLIVIDLKLHDGQMQGDELIKELAYRDVPCELMAISGAVPSLDFADDIICFGAATLLTKPFDLSADFYPRAKRLAEIGQKRRMRSLDNPHAFLDVTRKERPVFLSYANEDTQMANGIRRHIESYNINVWYAPTAICAGSNWREEIERGLESALIFIPLITDSFLSSDMCLRELDTFLKRIEAHNTKELLVLPVACNLSDRFKNSDTFQSLAERYHYGQLRPRSSDCLTTLLWRIQAQLDIFLETAS